MRIVFLFLFLFFLGGVYLVFRGESWAAEPPAATATTEQAIPG